MFWPAGTPSPNVSPPPPICTDMNRVPRIIFQRNDELGPYNFVAKASWTGTDWALDLLTHRGVPRDKDSGH